MPIARTLLPEFDQEMASTRKTLERVPNERFDWKPHPKSFTVGHLATHLTHLPSWAVNTLEKDFLDLAPKGGAPPKWEPLADMAAVLAEFDRNVTAARKLLEAASDNHLLAEWSLKMGGQTLMRLPRTAVLRSFVMNHMIHHRAQLGVYLRLMDVPVPALYGPTADEPMNF